MAFRNCPPVPLLLKQNALLFPLLAPKWSESFRTYALPYLRAFSVGNSISNYLTHDIGSTSENLPLSIKTPFHVHSHFLLSPLSVFHSIYVFYSLFFWRIKINGITRTRGGGKEAVTHCNMPPTVPDKEKLSRFDWGKVEERGKWLLKLFLPRISERNGPICCYR